MHCKYAGILTFWGDIRAVRHFVMEESEDV